MNELPWHSVEAKKPPLLWRRSVEVDFVQLAAAAVEAAVFVAANPAAALAGGPTLVRAFRFEARKPEELAWQLVHGASRLAFVQLLAPHHTRLPDANSVRRLAKQWSVQAGAQPFVVDAAFLANPSTSPLLAAWAPHLHAWMLRLGLDERSADSVVARLPVEFVWALEQVWAESASQYQPLRDAIETPFAGAAAAERAWAKYHRVIDRALDRPLLDEPYSLRQLYVRPRGALDPRDKGAGGGPAKHPPRRVVATHDHLHTWLAKRSVDDPIRVVRGGPGAGKSSLALSFASEAILRGTHRILLVSLHEVDAADLQVRQDELFEFLINKSLQTQTVLKGADFVRLKEAADHTPFLVILDGLDEFVSQAHPGAEAVRELLVKVATSVRQFNAGADLARLQALLLGRDATVQGREPPLDWPGRTLELLPYFVPEDQRDGLDDPDDLLGEDLRDAWWNTYLRLTGQPESGLPSGYRSRYLADVTGQPLFNHLLARYRHMGGPDPKGEHDLSRLYHRILLDVHQRQWGDASQGRDPRHPQNKLLGDPEDFLRVLEEVAVAAWHGGASRRASEAQIRARLDEATQRHPPLGPRSDWQDASERAFGELVAPFREADGLNVMRLLATFHFRKPTGETRATESFEFVHKTFGEYLAARRIARAMEQIHTAWGWQPRVDLEHPEESLQQALVEWARLCGPTRMDLSLLSFLHWEVRVRMEGSWGPDGAMAGLPTTMAALVSHMIAHGMPMERLTENAGLPHQETERRARNAEEALVGALHSCMRALRYHAIATRAKLDVPAVALARDTALSEWLHRVRDFDQSDCVAVASLSDLNCVRVEGPVVGLEGLLKLRRAKGLILAGADLRGAELQAAYLANAVLEEADLDYAELPQAFLMGANLRRANLRGASLYGAQMDDADLADADLHDADLRGANLTNAKGNLEGAIVDYITVGVPDDWPREEIKGKEGQGIYRLLKPPDAQDARDL